MEKLYLTEKEKEQALDYLFEEIYDCNEDTTFFIPPSMARILMFIGLEVPQTINVKVNGIEHHKMILKIDEEWEC